MTVKKISLLFPLLLVNYEVIGYLSNDMYLPAMPSMMQSLALDEHMAQMTLTSWFIGLAALQWIIGPISDRIGRRPVLLMGGLTFILATLLCAVSQDITQMLIGRFIQGLSVSSIVVAGYASIHESYETKVAIPILAWMGAITILAPALGPLVGSVLLLAVDWRAIFVILGVWAMIALCLLALKMPESNPPENRPPLNLKKLVSSYYKIISNWNFLRLAISVSLLLGAGISWITASPFLIIDKLERTEIYFGIVQLIVFGGFILATQLIKWMMNHLGLNKIIVIGFSFVCLGSIAGFVGALLIPELLLPLVIAVTIFLFGTGLLYSPLQRLAIDASEEPMGARMAILLTLMSLGATFSSILVTIFYNGTVMSVTAVFALLAVLSIVLVMAKGRNVAS